MRLGCEQLASGEVQWKTINPFKYITEFRLCPTPTTVAHSTQHSPVSVYYISSDDEGSENGSLQQVDSVESPSVSSQQTIVLSSSSASSCYSLPDILFGKDAATVLPVSSEESYESSGVGLSPNSIELRSPYGYQYCLNSPKWHLDNTDFFRQGNIHSANVIVKRNIDSLEINKPNIKLYPVIQKNCTQNETQSCRLPYCNQPLLKLECDNEHKFERRYETRQASHDTCPKRKRFFGRLRQRERKRRKIDCKEGETLQVNSSSSCSLEHSEESRRSVHSVSSEHTTSADSYLSLSSTQDFSSGSYESASLENRLEINKTEHPDSPGDSKYTPAVISGSHIRFKLDSNNNPVVLGEGTTARVFRAEYDDQCGCIHQVAVKVYFDSDLRSYLTREARYMNFMEDTGFVPKCFGIVELPSQDGVLFGIVQQYCAHGMTMLDFMEKRNATLHACESVQITAQLFLGLSKIHNKKMLINDIKENNILIDPETLQVKFIDFNLASFDTAIQFDAGSSLQHRHFLAPEVREGESTSSMSDIYSLGHVLHRLSESLGTENMRYWSAVCRYRDPAERVATETAIMVLRNHVKYAYTCVCRRCVFDPEAFVRECDKMLS